MPLASSAPHDQPAVHPHEPGIHLTTSLAGLVVRALRHRSCRTYGALSFDCSARVLTGCRRLVALVSCLAFPMRLTGCP